MTVENPKLRYIVGRPAADRRSSCAVTRPSASSSASTSARSEAVARRRPGETQRRRGAAANECRVLLTCWPFDGHIVGPIAIAAALRERGHEVAIYTGETRARRRRCAGRIRLLSVPSRRRGARRPQHGRTLETGARQGSRPRRAAAAATFRDWLVETIPDQVADIQTIVEEWQPDVHRQATCRCGGHRRSCGRQPDSGRRVSDADGPVDPGADAPPWGLGMAPPRDAAAAGGRARDHETSPSSPAPA